MSEESYKQALAERIGVAPEQIHLYWKGRVGLYALLRAMGIGPGDGVLIQGFTCVVVPNAVIYAGARPQYADVSPVTLNATLEAFQSALTPETRCVIVQNTFGLSSEVDRIASWAREKRLWSIEDCTHGFGGTFQGKPNGSFCDAAFYSTQWNKPFSTGLGGFVAVHRPELLEPLRQVNRNLETPGLRQRLMLAVLLRARQWMLRDRSYWTLLRLYRWLSRKGLVLGSSSSEEMDSTQMPDGYFRGACGVQHRAGLQALKGLDALLELRRRNGLAYNTRLREWGMFSYADEDLPDHAFLKFPVFVRDKADFARRAEAARIRLGDWFSSPLHPVEGSLEPWGVSDQDIPVARKLSRHILNLPTDVPDPERVLDFLEGNSECIERRA